MYIYIYIYIPIYIYICIEEREGPRDAHGHHREAGLLASRVSLLYET